MGTNYYAHIIPTKERRKEFHDAIEANDFPLVKKLSDELYGRIERHKDTIELSSKHGVNPSVLHCECCGKDYGIAMFGRLKGYVEAPREVVQGFCNDCQAVIDQGGVLIVEIKDGEREKNPKNPYRTGRIVGCSKQYKERNDIKTPMVYMEEHMFGPIFGEHIKA